MTKIIETEIPEQIVLEGNIRFPLVINPSNEIHNLDDTLKFIADHRDELLKRLLQHGAVLFRHFPIDNPSDFNQFALEFGWKDLPYIGGAAPRSRVVGVVFTTNESPPSKPIPFHHEMAQVPKFPSHLFFYCDIPSSRGGATPICYSPLIYETIRQERPEFVAKLEEKCIRYTRILPDGDDNSSAIGRGWQSTYLTEDPKRAEELCKEQGTDYEWLENGCLKTVTKVLPAIRLDERTGKHSWFNSIVAAYKGWRDSRNDPKKAVTYGDGTEIEEEYIEFCETLMQKLCVSFKWEKGDVLLIDNKQVLHSREAFEPPRKILAALFQ
ncbi:unnamed protein product [Didymodactylos carnosus]|uniref:TauD/TfdA-like domain-containing protein n=1 Tax=Didymodactylos carnosus TaxID=1234261 RepID=A0A814DD41_9BILA|nr:unnamed protein product [Didymodactylos carnosus]CAF1273564.1 unnamed protein product [Didymodactylos carnosus]CAF3729438.1 unnamed protein product [Didymodactylos carnosus]CAF4078781.1 unnamed protein product [Didymodactylos carnosus]